jgi:diguanylate cyclase
VGIERNLLAGARLVVGGPVAGAHRRDHLFSGVTGPAFRLGVRAILAETGLEPHNLELELTETFLMEDSKSTLAVLNELKGIGVTLALDDFGTGYSSLSYLRRFPISALKIDRSFISGLTTDTEDASIVTAVIGLGNNLNLRVIAEGVETREQLRFLQQHDSPLGQGSYFSRLLPPEEMDALIRLGPIELASNAPMHTNPA